MDSVIEEQASGKANCELLRRAPNGLSGMNETRLALSFRVGAGPVEHLGETIDISAEQLLIRSPIQLEVGLHLEITVRVPVEFSGSPFTKMKFSGRVLSGRPAPEGRFLYTVGIERSRVEAR